MKRRITIAVLSVVALLIVAAVVALALYPRQITTWGTRVALQQDFDKQSWDHDRGHITYFKGGQGPPLLFVHGLADQAGSWHRIAGEFSDHTVVVVDLPSHGESPYSDGEVFDEHSRQLLFELFGELFDRPVTIVGNSLGGWISLIYALEHPDRVERLVPAGSGGLEHEIDPTLLMPEDREDARRTVRTIFGEDAPPTPGFVLDRIVERSGESVAQTAFERIDEAEYLDDDLPDLQVPVDLVWGTEDLIFPLDYAERMNDAIPRSRLHVIDGCGHSPQVGCPGEFAELLDEILASEPPAER